MKNRLIAFASLWCGLCALSAEAQAHSIFAVRYSPTAVYIDKPGIYQVHITVDPQFGNTGFQLSPVKSTYPEMTIPILIGGSGFFQDAQDTEDCTLYVIVLPGAQNVYRQTSFEIKQFYPPDGSDEHTITGPVMHVDIPPRSRSPLQSIIRALTP